MLLSILHDPVLTAFVSFSQRVFYLSEGTFLFLCLFLSQSLCLPPFVLCLCVSVCVSVYLSVCLSVCPDVCSVQKGQIHQGQALNHVQNNCHIKHAPNTILRWLHCNGVINMIYNYKRISTIREWRVGRGVVALIASQEISIMLDRSANCERQTGRQKDKKERKK